MPTWYFPKEVWNIIKRYEHDLLYPRKYIEKVVKDFKYHIHAPYWLGLHKYKQFENQYEFLKTHKTIKNLWNAYTDKLLRLKIHNEIKECIKIYY